MSKVLKYIVLHFGTVAYIEQELALCCADSLIWECMLQTVQAKLMEIMSVGFLKPDSPRKQALYKHSGWVYCLKGCYFPITFESSNYFPANLTNK